jgi:hypothetical protein
LTFFSNFEINDLKEQLSINPSLSLTPTLQQKYFENIEIFVKKGIPNLSEKIKKLCEESFNEYKK